MIDSHAHLHDPAFDLDRDMVVRRAREAGVEKIITIGTDLEESRKAVDCAEKYEGVFASVGIHPEYFNEVGREMQIADLRLQIDKMKELAKHPKVVAIGECGLDYFSRDPEKPVTDEQKNIQKKGFLFQIELAQELDLPIIIHCREAYEDMFSVLQSAICDLKSAIILHCYMGDTEVTKKFLTLPNVYFSFTGNITYPTKKALRETKDDLTEVVKMLPLERMMIETDSPYLAPQEHRGKRNEPANVALVAEKIAEIKGVSADEVKRVTSLHAENVFGV